MLSYLLTCVIIGIVATLGMSLFLWILTHFKLCDVDMVKAIGAWFTRREDTAFFPGMIVQLLGGILFSFAYIFLFSVILNSEGQDFLYVILGAGAGFVHGMVVAMLLVNMVAEHHPLHRFKRAGIKVALYHFLAHIIYGLIVGTLYIYLLGAKAL